MALRIIRDNSFASPGREEYLHTSPVAETNMPITFTCPECQRRVTVGDQMAGRQDRCPACGVTVVIPTPGAYQEGRYDAPPPAPPLPERERDFGRYEEPRDYDREDYRRGDYDQGEYGRREDYGRGDWARAVAPSWSTVRLGLGLMRAGIVTYIFSVLAIILFAIFGAGLAGGRPGARDVETIMRILVILGGGGVLVGFVLAFIGQCMCCGVPEESRVKGLAIGSVICIGLYILFAIVFFLFVLTGFGNPRAFWNPMMMGGGAPALIILGFLVIFGLLVTGVILFTLFLRGIGLYFGDRSLPQSAIGFLVFFGVFLGLYILFNFLMVMVGGMGGPRGGGDAMAGLAFLFGLLFVIGIIVLIVWALILLYKARLVIPSPRYY